MEGNIIYNSAENKAKSIVTGTLFTILLLLVSVSYGMTWGILFLVYTSKSEYDQSCNNLRSWDKSLYILQFISSGLHIVSSVFQLVMISYDKDSSIPNYIMGCRSCIVYVAGLIILFGINTSYFSHPDISLCKELKTINFAYIITEWVILGSCICLVCVTCIISILFKRRKRGHKYKNIPKV
jgi:hypothetical protein